MKSTEDKKKIVCKSEGAWLVTWEWVDDHTRPTKKVVSILDSHIPAERIKEYVEQTYADCKYYLSEQLAHAKPKPKKFNPYPARLQGGYYEKPHIHITCGDNPHLFARKVKSLRVLSDGGKNEILQWRESDGRMVGAI